MKLLIATAEPGWIAPARAGLGNGWSIVEELLSGRGRQADSLRFAIQRERPDVVYSPSVIGAGVYVARALGTLTGAAPAWLTSASGLDVMPDHLEELVADEVAAALSQAHGLLPFSTAQADAVSGAGFAGRILAVSPRPFAIDLDHAPAPSTSSPRSTIVIDGRQGRLHRGEAAIAALRVAEDRLSGRAIVVLDAGPDVALAARLLEADANLAVRVIHAETSTPWAVLAEHQTAAVSVRFSLDNAVDWWDVAALANNARLVVSDSADILEAAPRGLLRTVDPQDPTQAAAVICSALAECDDPQSVALKDAELTMRRYGWATSAAAFGRAVEEMASTR